MCDGGGGGKPPRRRHMQMTYYSVTGQLQKLLTCWDRNSSVGKALDWLPNDYEFESRLQRREKLLV